MVAISRALDQYVPLFSLLRGNTPSLWGSMTAQHMVEHLCDSMFMSMGKFPIPVVVVTAPNRLPVVRRYLLGTAPFPHNVANPLLSATPPPLQQPSLSKACEFLSTSINMFYTFFEANPLAEFPHPIFGILNAAEWEHFHHKHFHHHCEQFALLTSELKG